MGLLEYLKKILGDTEGQAAYDKIQADKENHLLVNPIKEPKYVEKKDVDAANETIKQYKKDIAKRDTDLVTLQGKVKDNEGLNTEIENLKLANKKSSEDYEAKLKQLNFDAKFEKTLESYKTKNPKAIKALLDMEKVKLDGESFLGLEEQLNALKESDSYLFEIENEEEEVIGGTGTIGSTQTKKNTETKNLGTILGEKRAKELTSTKEIEDKFFN